MEKLLRRLVGVTCLAAVLAGCTTRDAEIAVLGAAKNWCRSGSSSACTVSDKRP